ncbi:MAG: nuclear transport factor 2 family protein [Polyangia bacterium]
MTNLERAKSYLRAIESRDGSVQDFFSPDVIQEEFPNRLVPGGATRDRAALLAAGERGKRAVSSERYELVRGIEQGDEVALELIWTGTLALPFGALPVGGTMRARIGVFLTFRDGLIVSQRNYDCFDPF